MESEKKQRESKESKKCLHPAPKRLTTCIRPSVKNLLFLHFKPSLFKRTSAL